MEVRYTVSGSDMMGRETLQKKKNKKTYGALLEKPLLYSGQQVREKIQEKIKKTFISVWINANLASRQHIETS